MFSHLVQWQQASTLVGTGLLGSMLLVLVGLLPFLSNNQSGLICLAIALITILTTVLPVVPRRPPIQLPLGCYWLIATAATIFSPVPRAALDGWIKLSLYLLVYLAFDRVFNLGKLPWRSLLLGTYLASALIVEAYGLRQAFLGAEELATWTDPTSPLAGVTRIYSFLGNPNLLAGYLLPTIPFGIVGIFIWRSWGWKLLAALVAIGGFYCVRETYSRGGLYGMYAEILVLVLILIYWYGKLPQWTVPTFLGSTLTVMISSILLLPNQRERFFSTFLGRGDSSGNFRLNVWAAVAEMIKARPILGIGNGNRAFNQIYPLFQRPGFSALGTYSVPLEITVETGFLGLGCFIWLLVAVYRHGIQVFRPTQRQGLWVGAGLSVVTGMMVHGLVDTVWFRPQVQILWWLAIALITSFETSGDLNLAPDPDANSP